MDEKIVKDSQGLAKELVNDCISRQAAIDATWFEPSYTDPLNVLTEVRDRLKELPSVQPKSYREGYQAGFKDAQLEQPWIPCNEKDAEYPCIACDVFGQIFITDGGIVKINGECYDGTGFDFSNADEFLKGEKVGNAMRMLPRKIVAWLPLPEPYKGDDK